MEKSQQVKEVPREGHFRMELGKVKGRGKHKVSGRQGLGLLPHLDCTIRGAPGKAAVSPLPS